jgi:hypothetical protein
VSPVTAVPVEFLIVSRATERKTMVYVKAILSGLAAIIATELLTIWWTLRPWSSTKAIGIDLIVAIMKASLVHALPWIVAILLFTAFFAAGRLSSRSLRVVLFWIPMVSISAVGITLASSIAYLITKFKP